MGNIIKNIDDFNKTNNGLDIVCLGYKKAFGAGGPGTGDKMWYYKLNSNNKEYLLVNAGMIRLLHMIWTNENDFDNSDLWDDFERPFPAIEKKIEDAVESTPKVERVLAEDEEKTFFTQHEVKEPEPVVIPDRVGNVYTDDEVNDILNILRHEFDLMYDEDVYCKITQEVADWANKNGYDKLFDELVGYKFKFEKDGEHKNDGQMVEYTFTFKSPSGEKTKFSTEMCLMVGWNYHRDLQIK
jgi:hypothetical protein